MHFSPETEIFITPNSYFCKGKGFKKPLSDVKPCSTKSCDKQSPQSDQKARGRHPPLRPSPSFPPRLCMQGLCFIYTSSQHRSDLMSYPTFFLPTLSLSFGAGPPIFASILCLPPASGSRISAGRPPRSRSRRTRLSRVGVRLKSELASAKHSPSCSRRSLPRSGPRWGSGEKRGDLGRSCVTSLLILAPPRPSSSRWRLPGQDSPARQPRSRGPSARAFHVHISPTPSSSVDPYGSNEPFLKQLSKQCARCLPTSVLHSQ